MLECRYDATIADDRSATLASGGNAAVGGAAYGGGDGIGGGGGVTSATNPNRSLGPTDLTRILASSCATLVEPEPVRSKLELVVDVSTSVKSVAPGSTRTKWEVMQSSLLEWVVGVLGPGLPNATSVGLLYYPNKVSNFVSPTPVDPSVCINVDGEIGMSVLGDKGPNTQRTLLGQRLAVAVLGRGTPTVDAYDWALRSSVLSVQQRIAPGDPYLLLITDGEPTLNAGCSNPNGALTLLDGEPVVRAVAAAREQGVKTFVVGSPGSEEARPWLSRAAHAGGTGRPGCHPERDSGPYCHLDLTNGPAFDASLPDALARISTYVGRCRFELAAPSDTPASLGLIPLLRFSNGGGTLLGQSTPNDDDCADGYRVTDEAQLQLCKESCKALMDDEGARLNFLLGCSLQELFPN